MCLKSFIQKFMSTHPVNVGADKLALQGMCPVSYHFGPPAKGKPEFKSERNGAVYWFSSKEAKGMFDAGVPTKTRTYASNNVTTSWDTTLTTTAGKKP